jgi:hypothetical protein
MGMNSEKVSELHVSSAAALEQRQSTLERKLEAQGIIRGEIEAMKEAGSAIELSDEEIRMIRELRRFKESCKPGAVFSWQTRPANVGAVLIAEDTTLIEDPRYQR